MAKDREQRLDEVLAAFLEADANGWGPERQRLLACYPQLAEELNRFFAGEALVEQVAAPLRPEEPRRPQPLASTITLAEGASTAAPATDWPQVPGYEILEEVGHGGMGVVYKARQVQANRTVALKMILTGGHAGSADRERFRSEAEAIARLQHPNIVQIHEVGEHDRLPFFSLEFCDGGSLADHLDGTPLQPRPAAQLVETLARAIHACHERRIIHRDLKPANVLLAGEPGRVSAGSTRGADATPLAEYIPKITDFGLAKNLDASGRTASGAILGTPSYMAPEQADSRQQEVGPASDVYALGAILYELLTGRPPFRGPTPLDTIMQVVQDEPVPPAQLQPQTPPDLERICLKCLEKSPARRYLWAQALADDLARYQRGEPVQARPVGRAERLRRWCKRNPAVAALLAAVALTLLAGATTATVFAVLADRRARAEGKARQDADDAAALAEEQRRRAVQEEERARQETARAEKQLWRAEWLAYAGQISRAQREWQHNNVARARDLLDACRLDLRDWEHRYLHTLFTGNQRTLRGHTHEVGDVCFSPDGKRLASASGHPQWPGKPGELKVWDWEWCREILALKGHTDKVRSVCFSPDGKRLASASDPCRPGKPGEVRVWDAEQGQVVLTLKGYTGGVTSVCFSPDGKRLASTSEYMQVKVWDAERGQEQLTLKGHTEWVTSVCFSPDGKRLASASSDKTVKVWLNLEEGIVRRDAGK